MPSEKTIDDETSRFSCGCSQILSAGKGPISLILAAAVPKHEFPQPRVISQFPSYPVISPCSVNCGCQIMCDKLLETRRHLSG
jgi:hypothetical protein